MKAAVEDGALVVVPRSVSRTRLQNFYQENAHKLRHFANDNEVSKESRRLRDLSGSTILQRVRSAVGQIFGGVSIGPSEYPVQITIASNASRYAVRDDSVGQIIRLEEDHLSPATLAKLLDAYSPLAPEQRPIIVIETDDASTDIDRRLRQVPETFEVARFGDHGGLRRLLIEREPCPSLEALVDQYAENSFSSIARMSSRDLIEAIPVGAPLATELAARLFHLRALGIERGKFSTLPAAQSLAGELERLRPELSGPGAEILLATRLFSNLWLLYCEEGPRELLDNAMAIAASLGSDVMTAHCLRMINTVEPHNAFTEHCSRRAATIFLDHEMYELSNCCLNNALIGAFYSMQDSSSAFEDAIETSAADIVGFRGLSIMMNNAGVAHLIEGNYLAAASWLERARSQPSWPLHRFSVEVNLLIAKYLEGEDPESDRLLSLGRAILRQVDPRYRHQRASLLLNLAVLAKSRPGDAAEFRRLITQAGIHAGDALFAQHPTLSRLGCSLGLSGLSLTQYPGLRGAFVERVGLVPVFHHAWL